MINYICLMPKNPIKQGVMLEDMTFQSEEPFKINILSAFYIFLKKTNSWFIYCSLICRKI